MLTAVNHSRGTDLTAEAIPVARVMLGLALALALTLVPPKVVSLPPTKYGKHGGVLIDNNVISCDRRSI